MTGSSALYRSVNFIVEIRLRATAKASGDGVCAGAVEIEKRSITPMIIRRSDIIWFLPIDQQCPKIGSSDQFSSLRSLRERMAFTQHASIELLSRGLALVSSRLRLHGRF